MRNRFTFLCNDEISRQEVETTKLMRRTPRLSPPPPQEVGRNELSGKKRNKNRLCSKICGETMIESKYFESAISDCSDQT